MNTLTDEERRALRSEHGWALETIERIEAAVLAKLAQQEPLYLEVRCEASPQWMRVDQSQYVEYTHHGWTGRKLYAAPVPAVQEPGCNPHPDAPHGFNRNASHSEGRYVCECESWEPEPPAPAVQEPEDDDDESITGYVTIQKMEIDGKLYWHLIGPDGYGVHVVEETPHEMWETAARIWEALREHNTSMEPWPFAAPVPAVVPDEDAALDLLAEMFDAYENGVSCYEDPEEQAGYVGEAVRLDDKTFRKIADLLNRRRPRPAPEAPKAAPDPMEKLVRLSEELGLYDTPKEKP